MRERTIAILLTIIVLFIGVHRTYGGERVIILNSDEVRATVGRDSTSAQSYVVTVPVPEGIVGDEVHRALLEFYADVFGLDSEEYQNESALVEVYAVDGPVAGELEPGQLRLPSVMTRNVVVGENRRVLVDITEFLWYNLTKGVGVHTLMVGFVRDRDGVFRIRDDAFGAGKPARVTIVELPTNANE